MKSNTVHIGPPFAGQLSNANPHALPANASQSQTNLGAFSGGMLEGRRGMTTTAFANSISPVASNVIACTAFNRAEGRYCIYVTASGILKVGRDPA
jgi:hypothetical protein